VAERFHIHTEEVEPGVFEVSLEHQEGDRRLLGTRWRTVAVLARRRYLANDMFGLAAYRARSSRRPATPPPATTAATSRPRTCAEGGWRWS
jgi:hypothetical protein